MDLAFPRTPLNDPFASPEPIRPAGAVQREKRKTEDFFYDKAAGWVFFLNLNHNLAS
jgi:hypothetical protein